MAKLRPSRDSQARAVGGAEAAPPAARQSTARSRSRADSGRAADAPFDAHRAARDIENALREHANPTRASTEKTYLRSELRHIGASVPAIRKVVKDWARAHALERQELVALAKALWLEPIHERRMAAVELLSHGSSLLTSSDLVLVERLIRESRTWAYVDHLAAHIASGLIERFPELAPTLDRWAGDENFWVRRSAMLALLRPLRRGEGDFERFSRYADAMLEEREFFVRKAIGWVLRDTGRKRPELVYRWLRPRTARVSGVTLREALKVLNEAQRAELLAARERPARRRSA